MDFRTAVRSAVEIIFNNWTALQLAVEHGMAGPQSHLAAVQFTDYMTDVFCQKANIESEEVEDILIELMDSEFHTICEDDSPLEVSRELWRLFQLCRSGNAVELEAELDKFRQPACKLWLSRPAEPQPSVSVPTPRPETPPPQLMEADPEEWTVVPNRRKN